MNFSAEFERRVIDSFVADYVAGLTLPAITKMLKLENKSGAKAFIVSGVRKLKSRLRPRQAGGRPERE